MISFEERKKQVDYFIISKGKYFPTESLPYLKEQLMNTSDDSFMMATSVEYKDPLILLIISIIGGSLGIDRFVLGEIGLGILKLITAGACGIWTIIDWFLIMNKTRESNFQKILSII